MDIRVVDSLASPHRLRSMNLLNLDGVRKASIKIMVSQLSDKRVITNGLSSLVERISKTSNIRDLIITVSATRSYTDQAHFDELVAWLGKTRIEGNLELNLEGACGFLGVEEKGVPLSVDTHEFMWMRIKNLE